VAKGRCSNRLRVQQWGIAGFGKAVLASWIEIYVELTEEDAAEYRRLMTLQLRQRMMQELLTGRIRLV
jgi:hypothetical protein